MAFNGNFLVTQGTDLTGFQIQDNSAGVDANITGRTIYLYTSSGALLVPAIDWPLSAAIPFVVTGIMQKDYAFSVLVTWTSSSPIAPPSTYTKTEIVTFVGYTNQFIYSLIQEIAANNKTLNDNSFQTNLSTLYNELNNAIKATSYSDQFSAQSALDRAKYLMDNSNYYF
jgi:hypothetical protein